MDIKHAHDQEQREAEIEAVNARFQAEMMQINLDHQRRIRRINFWHGAAVGAVIILVVTFTTLYLLVLCGAFRPH